MSKSYYDDLLKYSASDERKQTLFKRTFSDIICVFT